MRAPYYFWYGMVLWAHQSEMIAKSIPKAFFYLGGGEVGA